MEAQRHDVGQQAEVAPTVAKEAAEEVGSLDALDAG